MNRELSMQKERIITASRARSAIYGAIIGDALGTTFEFTSASDAKSLVGKYGGLKNGLVGRGPFNLEPGQFTDDTEMALAIMYVISTNNLYDQSLVSIAYRSWYASEPFDIGNTTLNAVSQKSTIDMLNAAKTINAKSLSNGFLMRLFGLVGLYYDRPKDKLLNSIVQDVKLTHGHPEAPYIAMIYGLMLADAISGKNAHDIMLVCKSKCRYSPLIFSIYNSVIHNKDYFIYDSTKYELAKIDTKSIGFVGYAFWLLLLSLKNYSSYKLAMIDIVSRGGDTDTNACIVGAVMGAIYPNTIPKQWLNSVLTFRSKSRFESYPISNPAEWTKWLP